MLTLIAVNFVLLAQVITGWMGGGRSMQGIRSGVVVLTVLFVLSMGMLLRIAWAGAFDENPAGGPPKNGGVEPQMSGRTASQANVGRHPSRASHA